MATLGIKGHPTRGGEVIQLLEMLGGENWFNISGAETDGFYYISEDNKKIYHCLGPSVKNVIVYTLEEFFEKFPYKIGDKVNSPCKGCIKIITSMWWDTYLNTITYELDHRIYTNIDQLKVVNDLQSYKEERKYADLRFDVDQDDKLATEATIDGDKITPPENYLIGKITKVDNSVLVEFVKKQSPYPKDYNECCKVLMGKTNFQDFELVLTKLSTNINEENSISPEPPYISLINKFYKLLICRDAYWKIAGEEMGLDKHWKPDWASGKPFYCISVNGNIINKGKWYTDNKILAFPTTEMRDTFYENFKEEIEMCKELL